MKTEQLEPRECFRWFSAIAAIPRGSHNEKQISDFLVRFATERGLDVIQDAIGNVCIKKPGTVGKEKLPAVILQGHMDMVCVKGPGKVLDFAKDGITLVVDGDAVKADGTTLGADNGIALAYIMALLDAVDIPHPPLEAVITVEEETGMTGAKAFDVSVLTGTRFINIDSEEEGVFCVSCAGGRRSEVSFPAVPVSVEGLRGGAFYTISATGLAGGHSGIEIDKQRGNAIRLLGRFLNALICKYELHLVDITGGSAANVIPSEAVMTVYTTASHDTLQKEAEEWEGIFKRELAASDGAGLVLQIAPATNQSAFLAKHTTDTVATFLTLVHDGVASMSLEIEPQRLVESSANLGVVRTGDGRIVFSSLVRSSVNSRKDFLCSQIAAAAAATGGTIVFSGDYPAWEYESDSPLRCAFSKSYLSLFNREARTEGLHAGLECGIFFEKFHALGRKVDFIAFGPDIHGAHTTKETVSRKSVGNMWLLLKDVLGKI